MCDQLPSWSCTLPSPTFVSPRQGQNYGGAKGRGGGKGGGKGRGGGKGKGGVPNDQRSGNEVSFGLP